MSHEQLTDEQRGKGIFADWETAKPLVIDQREVRVRANSGGVYQPADPRINVPGTVIVTNVPGGVSTAELCARLNQCVVMRRPISRDYHNPEWRGCQVVSFDEIKPGAIIRKY